MTWLRFPSSHARALAVTILARSRDDRKTCERILMLRFATFVDSPPSSGHAALLTEVLDEIEKERAKLPAIPQHQYTRRYSRRRQPRI